MAYREVLPEEDWAVLQSSIAAIFKLIAVADGKIDKKEQKAIENIIAKSSKLRDSMAKEVLASIDSPESLIRTFEGLKISPKEVLRKAAFILDHKIDSQDGVAFKKHLIAIGVYIGNASGSLFNYKMSYEEIEALQEAGDCLHISVKDLEQTNIILDIINTIDG